VLRFEQLQQQQPNLNVVQTGFVNSTQNLVDSRVVHLLNQDLANQPDRSVPRQAREQALSL